MDNKRINAGYVITSAVSVGNTEFVLGVHSKAPEQFVTWECQHGTDYIWGHYTDNLLSATKDLCARVMSEIEYLEQREQGIAIRNANSEYFLLGIVKHGENKALIQFPSKRLEDVLGGIGITLPPERVYLSGHPDIEVEFRHEGGRVPEGLLHLLDGRSSLRMVNELAESVLQSDWRVYERVKKNLSRDLYQSPEDLLRDVVWYAKEIGVERKVSKCREER